MTFIREEGNKPGNHFSTSPQEKESRVLKPQPPKFWGSRQWVWGTWFLSFLSMLREVLLCKCEALSILAIPGSRDSTESLHLESLSHLLSTLVRYLFKRLQKSLSTVFHLESKKRHSLLILLYSDMSWDSTYSCLHNKFNCAPYPWHLGPCSQC